MPRSVLASQMKTVLPRGVFASDGTCDRLAVLRPLSGYLEAQLAEGPPDPVDISHILAACLVRIGAQAAPSVGQVAQMTIGDREHLLLQLRAAALGPTIRMALRCPNPSCHQLMTLSLDTAGVCVVPPSPAPALMEVETPAGLALLREPTGEDEAALLRFPESERGDRFWVRVLYQLGSRGNRSLHDWRSLPLSVRRTIMVAYDNRRRGPRLSGQHTCSECNARIPWSASAGTLLAAELAPGVARLPEEVHAFAWHYGWSEHDTLSLPRMRRWHYLRRLGATVGVHP